MERGPQHFPNRSEQLRAARDWLRGTNESLINGWDTQAVAELDLALVCPQLPVGDPATREDAGRMAEDTLFYLRARCTPPQAGHREIIPPDDSGLYTIWPIINISLEFDVRELFLVEWRATQPPADGLHVKAWVVTQMPEPEEVMAQHAARLEKTATRNAGWRSVLKRILK